MKRVESNREYIAKLRENMGYTSQIKTALRDLVSKQLEVDSTSLHDCKVFLSSSREVCLLSSFEGVTRASDYRSKLAKLEQENDLLQEGLSSEQVRVFMRGQEGGGRCPRDPSIREMDLSAIGDTMDNKHRFIQQQPSNTNCITMSRHGLELELSTNNTATDPLNHLLGRQGQSAGELSLLQSGLRAIESRAREGRKRRRGDDRVVCREDESVPSEEVNTVIDCREREFDLNQVTPMYPSHVNNYKLSITEIKQISRFSSYTPGTPSNKLFVKNLHRNVTLSQLVSLFIKFQRIPGPSIKIRLLSGKMKGQAFVEFDCIETATQALYYVTGYILLGRPVIAVYSTCN